LRVRRKFISFHFSQPAFFPSSLHNRKQSLTHFLGLLLPMQPLIAFSSLAFLPVRLPVVEQVSLSFLTVARSLARWLSLHCAAGSLLWQHIEYGQH
jgi:hypothetical protein